MQVHTNFYLGYTKRMSTFSYSGFSDTRLGTLRDDYRIIIEVVYEMRGLNFFLFNMFL